MLRANVEMPSIAPIVLPVAPPVIITPSTPLPMPPMPVASVPIKLPWTVVVRRANAVDQQADGAIAADLVAGRIPRATDHVIRGVRDFNPVARVPQQQVTTRL